MSVEMAMAAAQLMQQIIGEKQVGGVAPAFGTGVAPPIDRLSPQVASRGGTANVLESVFNQQDTPDSPVSALLNKPPKPAGTAPVSPMGPPSPQDDPLAQPQGFGGMFESFFGNLDHNLQSPSKVIGMGLLNRIDPRLGAAGLIAGGLLGPQSFSR